MIVRVMSVMLMLANSDLVSSIEAIVIVMFSSFNCSLVFHRRLLVSQQSGTPWYLTQLSRGKFPWWQLMKPTALLNG